MNNSLFFSALLLVFGLNIISSCTVQKRVHRKGWFIQWHHNKTDEEKSTSKQLTVSNEGDNPIVNEKNSSVPEVQQKKQETFRDKKDHPVLPEREPSLSPSSEDTTEDSEKTENTRKTSKEREVNPQNEKQRLEQEATLLLLITVTLAIAAGVYLLIYLTWSPWLIPVVISILAILITYVSIQELSPKLSQEEHKAIIRRKLIWMYSIILAAATFAFLITLTTIPFIYSFTFFILGLFILMSIVLRKKNRQKKESEDELLDKESPESEPEPKNENEAETTDQSETKASRVPPLKAREAFPGLTAGIFLLIFLTIITALILMVAAAAATLLSIPLGPLFLVGIGIAVFLFLFAIVLGVSRGRQYQWYLEDYNNTDHSQVSTKTDKKKTEPPTKKEKRSTKGLALAVLIFILFTIGAVSLTYIG